MPFFISLEEEIHKAEMLGKSIFLEMDANCKLGPEFIENDPHIQSTNGRMSKDANGNPEIDWGEAMIEGGIASIPMRLTERLRAKTYVTL